MSSIIANSFGGVNVMSSAVSEANLIRGQAERDKKELESFSQKLKAVQDKAERLSTGVLKSPEEERKLKDACQEMEALFLNMMLARMRDTVPERTLFSKSSGEKMMQSMLDVELTRNMAKAGGMGIGALLYKQLTNPGLKHAPQYTIQPGAAAGEDDQ